MSTNRLLLPVQLHEQVRRAEYAAADPLSVARVLEQAWQRRHSELAALDPRGYTVPTSSALLLYRRDPKQYRKWVTVSLGHADADNYWRRLAAAARDAYQGGDWRLLGQLAFHADRAFAQAGPAETKKPREDKEEVFELASEGPRGAGRVIEAFGQVFDLARGGLTAANYLTAALAYFESLPEWFILTPDLLTAPAAEEDEEQVADSWPLLRWFWRRHPGLWGNFPQALDAGEKCPCPYVGMRVQQLRAYQGAPEALPEETEPAANPFTPYAAGVAEERPPEPPPVVEVAPVAARRGAAGRVAQAAAKTVGYVKDRFKRTKQS